MDLLSYEEINIISLKKLMNVIFVMNSSTKILNVKDVVLYAALPASISRNKDKGRSGGFGTRSRGVWVRNPTRSGIGWRDVTMPDRRQWKGTDFTVRYIDSDTRVTRRRRPATDCQGFPQTRIRRNRLRRCTVLPAGDSSAQIPF